MSKAVRIIVNFNFQLPLIMDLKLFIDSVDVSPMILLDR